MKKRLKTFSSSLNAISVVTQLFLRLQSPQYLLVCDARDWPTDCPRFYPTPNLSEWAVMATTIYTQRQTLAANTAPTFFWLVSVPLFWLAKSDMASRVSEDNKQLTTER